MLQSEVLPKVFWVWQENRVCKRNGGERFKKKESISLSGNGRFEDYH